MVGRKLATRIKRNENAFRITSRSRTEIGFPCMMSQSARGRPIESVTGIPTSE